MNMWKYIVVGLMSLLVSVSYAQNPKFDKLEMYFAQGHYKKVYRKANRLLDKPEYDFSILPKYYKSLSLLQLSQNEYWLITHPDALDDATELFKDVKRDEDFEKLYNSHLYELSWVKTDMMEWAADLQRQGKKDQFEKVQKIIEELFGSVPGVEMPDEKTEPITIDSTINLKELAVRDQVVEIAKKYIGVPYVWAGNTPEGFDCSGFTGYVMKEVGVHVPRRSSDQFNDARKVKSKNVQKGDLVFFSNGSGVSHVGIVVSEKGQPLQMIHASSSKGIIITSISESEYWLNRIHGYGTYIN